jgi:hypothetical protein
VDLSIDQISTVVEITIEEVEKIKKFNELKN